MHVWNFHIEEFMKEEEGKEEGKELLFIKMKLLRDPLQEKFPSHLRARLSRALKNTSIASLFSPSLEKRIRC